MSEADHTGHIDRALDSIAPVTTAVTIGLPQDATDVRAAAVARRDMTVWQPGEWDDGYYPVVTAEVSCDLAVAFADALSDALPGHYVEPLRPGAFAVLPDE